MEQIYTIPVHEAFEACRADAACGCPFCRLYNQLEENELDLILGASMMEPDIRLQTNRLGFCRTHYDRMFVRKNRLGMALTLESHLNDLAEEIRDGGVFSAPGQKPIRRIQALESSCYVCGRIETHFVPMVETAVLLWEREEEFEVLLRAQPYFCLPHYRLFLSVAQGRLSKKEFAAFEKICAEITERYLNKLREDVSWFCKKFDYRYDEEPWYDSKDAVERAIRFLRSDLHVDPEPKKQKNS